MRSVFSKQLKPEFHCKMKEAFPAFTKTGTDMGGIVYRSVENDCYIFVLLWPHRKMDSFTLELATNDEPDYPFALFPGDRQQKKCRFRIQHFVSEPKDGWWHINKSHEPDLNAILNCEKTIDADATKIPGLVADAVERLASALDLFRQEAVFKIL